MRLKTFFEIRRLKCIWPLVKLTFSFKKTKLYLKFLLFFIKKNLKFIEEMYVNAYGNKLILFKKLL